MSITTESNKNTLRAVDYALVDLLQRQFPHADKSHATIAGLVSYQLAQGHLCLPLSLYAEKAAEIGISGNLPASFVDSQILSHAGKTPVVLDLQRLYLYRYWQLEQQISHAIVQRLGKPDFSATEIKPVLAKLFPASSQKELDEQQSNWQQIACVLAANQRFGIITGGPGTGKTTTVVKLLTLLQTLHFQQTQHYLTVKLAAPTGKAAARLSESISKALDEIRRCGFDEALIAHLPAKATTLHRLLGRQTKTRHFYHNENNPIAAELIVIDEASMIDIDMMDALLRATAPSSRLILVGDKDQLASVEAGAVMSELCREADKLRYQPQTQAFLQQSGCELKQDAVFGAQPVALSQVIGKLQKCWRTESAAIIELAHAINQQNVPLAQQIIEGSPNALARVLANNDWIEHEVLHHAQGIATLLQKIKQAMENHHDSDAMAKMALEQLTEQQLLTPLRRGLTGVDTLNQQIRQKAQRLAKQYGLLQTTNEQEQQPFIGEPLLVTKNLYDLGVMNGDVGIVLPQQHNGLRVAFNDGEGGIRWIIPEQLQGNSQGAYAITVHQSQGSEYKRVLLCLPSDWNPILTKELLYTAVTRAKQQFVLLENSKNSTIFSQAIAHKTVRYSGLADRLYR